MRSRQEVFAQVLAQEWQRDGAQMDAPAFLSNVRHACPKARQSAKLGGKGVSTAIGLKERYVTLRDAIDQLPDEEAEAWTDEELDGWAMVWREGRCARCGIRVRSKEHREVQVLKRPPITGRMARG